MSEEEYITIHNDPTQVEKITQQDYTIPETEEIQDYNILNKFMDSKLRIHLY